jgi:hypothetical protein
MKILVMASIMMFLIPLCVTAVFAGGNTSVGNQYFSIKIPDSWSYIEGSNTPEAKNQGFGPLNSIELTPSEFSDILASRDIQDGPYAQFIQDTDYPKNAPLESYVKNRIDNFGISNITSQQYTTVGKVKAIKLNANQPTFFGDSKHALYLVMHDKVPYLLTFVADAKSYEKYLPEFEQMVKSFRFVGSSGEIENSSENENITNTKTNFSGINLNRPYLGIVGLSLTPDLSNQIGLNRTKGALLTGITKGSPAENAGLRGGSTTITYNGTNVDVGGDIILKIDNQSVSKMQDIITYLSQKHPGDNVHLTILRNNLIREPDVVLSISPSQDRINSASNLPNDNNKSQEELYNDCVNVAGKILCAHDKGNLH